ncbi:LapA family protein [Vannielia sp.]|uniref:LapA family protein n=1 Tax=Vannielia sp. TaxID=2813045 RepID=UPI0026341C7E|nr:LapA family protein [Vannielia sp.]MDF1873518.1 LapA family protein [Vannielia sp.]
MIRYLRYGFLAALALVLLTLALANREPVTLKLLPAELAEYLNLPYQMTVPLFLALFAMIALGLLVGFIWEWFREHKHRAEAARQAREAKKAKKALAAERTKDGPQDDVLALLDAPGKA